MKKLYLITSWLIACCIFPSSLFAAIDGDTVWEVRTTGSANNGGGFNPTNATPGTDYSQQDAAEDSGTDLACADGDAAAPVVTSATHNFVDADEGNLIQITETGDGFTVGWYEIVSTSGNAATLDRACGTDGAKTGGDWYLGGAVDHPNTISAALTARNIIYVKNGTYVKVGANAFVLSIGSSNISSVWIGYNAARTTTPTSTDRPIWDGDSDNNGINDTTNVIYYSAACTPMFKNIIIKRASADGIGHNGNLAMTSSYTNCLLTLNSDDGVSAATNPALVFTNCEISSNTDMGIDCSAPSYAEIYYSYIHDNGDNGIWDYQGSVRSYFSVYDTNVSAGINQNDTDASIYIGNVFYNNTGASGVGLQGNGMTYVFNNISVDNGKYGFATTLTSVRLFDYNLYNGNGTAGLSGITAGLHDSTSAPSFTASATGDFTLQAGSPALDTGMQPGTDTGLTGDYKINIGVDQDTNTVTAGGGQGGRNARIGAGIGG